VRGAITLLKTFGIATFLHQGTTVTFQKNIRKNTCYEIYPVGRTDIVGWNDGIANPAS